MGGKGREEWKYVEMMWERFRETVRVWNKELNREERRERESVRERNKESKEREVEKVSKIALHPLSLCQICGEIVGDFYWQEEKENFMVHWASPGAVKHEREIGPLDLFQLTPPITHQRGQFTIITQQYLRLKSDCLEPWGGEDLATKSSIRFRPNWKTIQCWKTISCAIHNNIFDYVFFYHMKEHFIIYESTLTSGRK